MVTGTEFIIFGILILLIGLATKIDYKKIQQKNICQKIEKNEEIIKNLSEKLRKNEDKIKYDNDIHRMSESWVGNPIERRAVDQRAIDECKKENADIKDKLKKVRWELEWNKDKYSKKQNSEPVFFRSHTELIKLITSVVGLIYIIIGLIKELKP